MKHFSSLKFVIFGNGKAWVAFHSAQEAQEYWENDVPEGNKKSGKARFFHFSGDATDDGDGLLPISQAYPEILEALDPRK